MTGSSDIAKLFRSFGGNAAEQYREIIDHDRQDASRARWPMLEQIPLQTSAAREPNHRITLREAPAAEKPVAPPQGGTLQDVFRRLRQEPEPAPAAKAADTPGGQQPAPAGMASIFQRLRRS